MPWLALGTAVLGWIATPEPQGPLTSPSDRPYWALVERYRRGDRPAVLQEMQEPGVGSRELRQLERLAQVASRCHGDCPARQELRDLPIEAAVMLHTDRALLAREQYDAERLELHFQRARQFSGVLLELEERRGFACRWFLGLGLWWQLKLDLGQAQRFLDAGVKECPQDPELLLAAGTLEETWAYVAPRTPQLDPPSSRRSVPTELTEPERFRRAERHYRRVVEIDDHAHGAEARLRLGWVLWRLAEADRAGLELEAAARQGRNPAQLYLAHLFRGRVAEGVGHLDRAQVEYLQAITLLPRAPTACLAVSHVLLRRGEKADSLSWLRRGLAASGREETDPWWLYAYGHSLEADDRLEALRREAGW